MREPISTDRAQRGETYSLDEVSEADSSRLLLEPAVAAPPLASRWHQVGLGVLLAGAAVVCLAVPFSSPQNSLASVEAVTLLEETGAGCSGSGQNCLETKCCIDGGAKGLQCYKKNDDWGECFELDDCKPGVHEGETEHGWDEEDQAWELLKWSCKAVGNHSRPGCDSFGSKGKCPGDRCSWGKEKCRAKCSLMPSADSCWSEDHCMWESEKCQDACWEVDAKEKCGSLDRCKWLTDDKGGRCAMACHVHGDTDCPDKEQCMVADGKCQQDPCSAPWEDCRETKCCSRSRGGEGMTCFEKDKTYATCMDLVDPKYQKGWSGKKLGNRTKFEAGCSWAGQSCSETHACCNEGFNCAVKDDNFMGCALNMKVTSWVKQHVDLPAGWDGTVMGGWRGEYAVDPAAEGDDVAGMSLYCIMVALPDSPEMDLLETAKKNGGSIFGCNASKVYHAWKTDSAGWDTGESTLVNTAVFLKVFEWVRDDGEYLKHDWLVKADPDCVFLADRLRGHLWGLRPPPNRAIYLKNNNVKGMGNSNFLGAIEVFSKRAIQIYLDNDQDCGKYLGTNSGEDGFFKGCMDALGVGFMWDHDMFKPNYDPAICTNGKYAAYHPMKYPSHWQRCWDIATGKMCQGMTYDCGGDLDPPITEGGIR